QQRAVVVVAEELHGRGVAVALGEHRHGRIASAVHRDSLFTALVDVLFGRGVKLPEAQRGAVALAAGRAAEIRVASTYLARGLVHCLPLLEPAGDATLAEDGALGEVRVLVCDTTLDTGAHGLGRGVPHQRAAEIEQDETARGAVLLEGAKASSG